MKRFFSRFSVFELVLLALCAAAGVAVKPLVSGIAHLVAAPLFIPSGALAGGFYMLFVVLGAAMVKKRGAALLLAVVQGLMVLVAGIYGSHGAASILTYSLPGLLVELVWLPFPAKAEKSALCCMLGGIAANLGGTVMVSLVFFRLPLVPLLLSLALSALSGALGGLGAFGICRALARVGVLGEERRP